LPLPHRDLRVPLLCIEGRRVPDALRTGLTADRLRGAPKYSRTSDWDWNDRARDHEVYDYYKAPLGIDLLTMGRKSQGRNALESCRLV
jgi:hypothetical protein